MDVKYGKAAMAYLLARFLSDKYYPLLWEMPAYFKGDNLTYLVFTLLFIAPIMILWLIDE